MITVENVACYEAINMTVICSEVLLWFFVGRGSHDYLIHFRSTQTKKRGAAIILVDIKRF